MEQTHKASIVPFSFATWAVLELEFKNKTPNVAYSSVQGERDMYKANPV